MSVETNITLFKFTRVTVQRKKLWKPGCKGNLQAILCFLVYKSNKAVDKQSNKTIWKLHNLFIWFHNRKPLIALYRQVIVKLTFKCI